jgi:hypothetical protein
VQGCFAVKGSRTVRTRHRQGEAMKFVYLLGMVGPLVVLAVLLIAR